MRILHISDTHNLHRQLHNLPTADIIIHSGDISMAGTGKEIVDFMEWFGSLNYRYKIFIAGNHDDCLNGKKAETIQAFLPKSCIYLCNSGITIGGLKFWGVPFFFSDDVTDSSLPIISEIPIDCDILITHRPPFGILDTVSNTVYGCTDLLQAVSNIRPCYHLFGHIHDAYGINKTDHTTFINSALVNEKYQLVNKPFVIDI